MTSYLPFLAATCFFIAACGVGEGEPCQEENDCRGSLMCCKASATLSVRGTCESSCEDVTTVIDSGNGTNDN